jgi:hypothetical protein
MQAGQKTALAGQATAERIIANLQLVILGKESGGAPGMPGRRADHR